MHMFKKFYYFIDNFDKKEIQNLNKNIALIYRNYNNNIKKGVLEEMIGMFQILLPQIKDQKT